MSDSSAPPIPTAQRGTRTVLSSLERLYARTPVTVPAAVRNAYHRWTHEHDLDAYENPPDPFAIRWIDPDRLESFTGRPYPPYRRKVADIGRVRGGHWDRRDEPPIVDEDYRARYELYRADQFSASVFFQSLEMHFDAGVPWEETPFVERCLALADRGDPSWRSLSSRSAILERCRAIDDLYEAIDTHGYRSQRALGERSLLRVTDEVVVDIGRDGTFLFVNGRHRLAIAKLLEIESIPVGVLVRHPDWMATRDALISQGDVPDHPDFREHRPRNV